MDEKTRRIWAGLVSYANGTATTAVIRSTIVDCMGWIAATMEWDVVEPVFMAKDLAKEAEEYRTDVDILLRFFCSTPNSDERDKLRGAAFEFLREHEDHIRGLVLREFRYEQKYLRDLNYSPDQLEVFKQQTERVAKQARYEIYHHGQSKLVGEDSLPLGVWVPSKGYKDLADPICDFLTSEYEKYLNSEVSRKDKKAAPLVPIFACPICNKLVMPKRIGRRHACSECSDRARSEKYRQKASLHEGRDYAWLNRLLHQEPGVRKVRLGKEKVKQRLREVKARQKNSRRCQGLLQDLRL
jgi:hypothetical protein